MTRPPSYPPDDVLRELGRLVWLAIGLEHLTLRVAAAVRPADGTDDAMVGKAIERAMRALPKINDQELQDRVRAWLQRTQKALRRRNEIMHAAPIASRITIGEEVFPPSHSLSHKPRRRDREPTSTRLDGPTLATITAELLAARDGGLDAIAGLDAYFQPSR